MSRLLTVSLALCACTGNLTGQQDGKPPAPDRLADLSGAEGQPASDGGSGAERAADTAGQPAGTPVAFHGKLSVSANRIVDQAGRPVQLRGMSFGWSNWWGQYWTAKAVSWLVDDWKVQIVRAAMGIEPQGAYLSNPDTERNKVITVVDEAIRRGIYVIIDWHDHNAPSNINESRAFFSDMAARYGAQPNVIYEIFNEPEGETWSQIKAYAADIVSTIRAKDPDNLIIVGTPNWSQDVNEAAASPLAGANIAYTLHFYAATHKQWLRDRASEALSAGVALFVTEWGVCEASGTGYLDRTETDAWLKFMDTNLLSWANWDIADKAGETCSALLPNSSPTGGWPESSLTEAGKLVRGKLRAYAGVTP
jgi:endoglucanase